MESQKEDTTFNATFAGTVLYSLELVPLDKKTMNKSHFKILSKNIKADITAQFGELIVTINTFDTIIALFSVESFFVEIFINKKSNKLEAVQIQDDREILYEYVKHLDIKELTSNL